MNHIKTELKEMLCYFGYTDPSAKDSGAEGGSQSDQSSDNVFKYEIYSQDMVDHYNKFIEHNDKVLANKNPAESIEINGLDSGCFELIPAANEQKS
jgi:Zn-dependent M28 family amino/carboxypeptidase